MGRPVRADEPGAVDGEAHRKFLQRDVMDDLVVGALQKRRIDRAEGLKPSAARPAANVTACCSAMPTSKQRSGKALPKWSSPVPSGMAAVIATILSSRLASAISASAKLWCKQARWPWASPARRDDVEGG